MDEDLTKGHTPPTVGAPPPEARALQADPERRFHQYILTEKLGFGGMGSVWKAWDSKLARWVAVKILELTDEEGIRRLQREARLSARLHHPNIASVYEVNEAWGRHFIVMEFIDGRSLEGAKPEVRRAAEIVRDAARAVHYAHQQGIIHRDLKPGNLMESSDGRVFVTDFGLAKLQETESSLSATGRVLGTPSFMPPEQARGDLDRIDERSDVYSLAATLYTLLVGQPPFAGPSVLDILNQVTGKDATNPIARDPSIPVPLAAIALKGLEKDPRRRYASAADLADDLDRFLRDEVVLARPIGPISRLWRKARRHRWAVAGGCTVVLACGITAWVLLRPSKPVEIPAEQAWRERFYPLRDQVAFGSYTEASWRAVPEIRRLLAEMPPSVESETRQWVTAQPDFAPRESWPKKEWRGRRPDAARILSWIQLMRRTVEGTPFEDVRGRLDELRDRFLPVTLYRGAITLKIVTVPYAELRGLRVGTANVPIPEDRTTPIVLHEVDVGDYDLLLYHPDFGERELSVSGEGLEDGATCVVSGKMEDPTSFRLRPLP